MILMVSKESYKLNFQRSKNLLSSKIYCSTIYQLANNKGCIDIQTQYTLLAKNV
jgi:hypothetical protein